MGAMSALVVMMLMLYALLVALSLMLWAVLNLRGRRPVDLAIEPEAVDRSDDLPPVPAVFAAKSAPPPEVHSVRTRSPRALGRDGRTAPEPTVREASGREAAAREPTARDRSGAEPTARTPRTPETPVRDGAAPTEGRASRSRIRVVPHPEEGAPAQPERERDDAFERFRTAKDDIDF
jgi:hypothetical protein